MEIITKYRAKDGIEFSDEQKCVNYEALIERVDKIMQKLNPVPNTSAFVNGGGFVQQDSSGFIQVKKEILEVCKEFIDHKWITDTMVDDSVHLSWVARLLSDHGIRPLENAWFRLQCVDKHFREWGQPYYSENPDKGNQIKLSSSTDTK